MSSFIGLHTALTGIRAGQRGLDTASHNVANATTPGYTRQRVDTASRIPWQSTVGPIATGVDVTGVRRLREAFLDTRVRTIGENYTSADTTAAMLQRAEDVVGEPDNGVTILLGDVYDAFDDLARRRRGPHDSAGRAHRLRGHTQGRGRGAAALPRQLHPGSTATPPDREAPAHAYRSAHATGYRRPHRPGDRSRARPRHRLP